MPKNWKFRLGSCGLVLLLSSWGMVINSARAELEGPTPEDRQITLMVKRLLQVSHVLDRPIDDSVSKKALHAYLKTLDPWRMYFYQSDVDKFEQQQTELDDQFNAGDIRFGFDVFKVFMTRMEERAKVIEELLKESPDFTLNEEMNIDPDAAVYPKDADEARELWRKRIKYDLLVLKAGILGGGSSKDKKKKNADEDPVVRLQKRYRSNLKRWQQTSDDELLEYYLNAITTSFDPHTNYMSDSSLKNFEIQMRLELDGIGAQLQSIDGNTVVAKIVPGGAADRDGRLKPDDQVIGVGQDENGAIVDVVDMKINDVVGLIRGKRGTVVRLQVIPNGESEAKFYNIVRDQIKLTESEARSKIIELKRDDKTFKLGVIELPSFYMDMEAARRDASDFKSSTRDVLKLLAECREKKVDAVVIDLRLNGGGSLTEAINLTGLFIDTGSVVQVKGKDSQIQSYDDMEQGAAWDGPLVVLTSKFSASASEIFAGAIQDYHRGIIIGDTSTHGKGTVQSLVELAQKLFRTENPPGMGALKVTIQQFYRPAGDSTQKRGVISDIILPSLTSHWDGSEAEMENALEFDTVPPGVYPVFPLSDTKIINALQVRTKSRQEKSEDFAKLERRIARYLEQKAKKTVTLNEKDFLAERNELNSEREQEQQLQKLAEGTSEVFDEKDFYNAETLNITADYLELLANPALITDTSAKKATN